MRTTRHTRIGTAFAAVVMASTLVACGGGSTGSSSTRDLSGARRIVAGYTTARDERSVRMAGEITVRTDARTITVPLDGAVDFANDAARFTVALDRLGLPGMGGASVETRVVDGRTYVRIPDLAARFLGGASWIEVPAGSIGGASMDPAGLLDALRGVAEVERVGTDTIRGVEATHYRATVDLSAAIDRAPADRREQLGRILDLARRQLPVDLWVDGQDRPVRFVAELNTPTGGADVHLDLFDYGADVTVTAPPADEVRSLDGLFGGSGTTRTSTGPTANA